MGVSGFTRPLPESCCLDGTTRELSLHSAETRRSGQLTPSALIRETFSKITTKMWERLSVGTAIHHYALHDKLARHLERRVPGSLNVSFAAKTFCGDTATTKMPIS